MQNEKIEDDFVRQGTLKKAIRLIANSQEGDEWLTDASLYWNCHSDGGQRGRYHC